MLSRKALFKVLGSGLKADKGVKKPDSQKEEHLKKGKLVSKQVV